MKDTEKRSEIRAAPRRYDAFISYSHQADAELAKALESHLERFAKPWFRLRAANIFRDETSLTPNPHLWPTIAGHLTESAHLILLASTTAANSKWVKKEVCHWITGGACDDPGTLNRDLIRPGQVERMLLVLTEGNIAWDDAASDFDWSVTSALPPGLSAVFAGEPLWVDMRWAREAGSSRFNRTNQEFIEAVARLSAPLRGLEIESLIGEDFRQHRRTMRIAFSAVAALALLTILVGITAFGFHRQWTLAERRATELTVAEGYRSIQLGSEQLASWKTTDAVKSFTAAQGAFARARHIPLMAWHRRAAADLATLDQRLLFHSEHGTAISDLHVSDDGKLVALVFVHNDVTREEMANLPAVEIWDVETGRMIAAPSVLSDAGRLVYGPWDEETGTTSSSAGSIVAVVPPADLMVDTGNEERPSLERLSLVDGSRSPAPWDSQPEHLRQGPRTGDRPAPLDVEFSGTALRFQPRHAETPVSFPSIFEMDPVIGNDRAGDEYAMRPDHLHAESRDGSRLLVGTHEGWVSLFECHMYGNQIARGRIAGIRGLKYVGKTRQAVAVDEGGDAWLLDERHPAIRRGLLPGIKADTSFGELAFTEDGCVLAGYSGKEIFACDLVARRALPAFPLPTDSGPLVAFGLDECNGRALALLEHGALCALLLDGRPSPDPGFLHLETEKGKHERMRAHFDFAERLVWVASLDPTSDKIVVLRAFSLDHPGPAVRTKRIPMESSTDILAMTRHRDEIIVSTGAGVPAIIRVPANLAGDPQMEVSNDGELVRDGPDRVWMNSKVDRFLPRYRGGSLFVEKSKGHGHVTGPWLTDPRKRPFRFGDAEAIVEVNDQGHLMTSAIIEDADGIAWCIEHAGTDLMFRTMIPATGIMQACAISRDGTKAAVATYDDGIILIDLGVYQGPAK